MKIIRKNPEAIKEILAEHLKTISQKNDVLFVFSSDVAATSWADWAVLNPKESGVQAVALENFIAWDKFKGSYLASGMQDKVCIPSILRKLFIRSLLLENTKSHFLTKIVPSDNAKSAYAFTDWISKIIPSLKLWHEKYLAYLKKNNLTAETDLDAENRDYNELYTRYNDFLCKNNFFETAWLKPEFVEQKKTIIIFYPELLEDFSDYQEIFSQSKNVISVQLPEEKNDNPKVFKYPDSRSELRHLILRIRKLKEKNVPYTDIAVSVPNIEIYRPYIRREFERYCVPINIRAGERLTKNSAGTIFRQISDCYTSNFSYDSVRTLLQNEYVPWDSETKIVKENFIREGNRLRTICSYEKDAHDSTIVDTWLEALSKINHDTRELEFYEKLKKEIDSICKASSFENLRTAYLSFKGKFFDTENFTSEANRILSRCISELNAIIEIENKYIQKLELKVEEPFLFFLNELDGKIYRPQEVIDGVSIFPYKLSAVANFPYQFVLDASQKNLDIPYKRLGFLNSEKRKLFLGEEVLENENASSAFIRLYAKNAKSSDVFFSYAEESFTGFAIAHNSLSVILESEDFKNELDKSDFIKSENEKILKRDFSNSFFALTKNQKLEFENWKTITSNFDFEKNYKVPEAIEKKANYVLQTHRRAKTGIVVTQKDLEQFYPCPRNWVLHSLLRLKEDSLDTNLMQRFDMGNINHKILEFYMKDVCEQKNPILPTTNENGIFDDEENVRKKIEDFTDKTIHLSSMDFHESPIVILTLESQKNLIVNGIMDFLHVLCKAPDKTEKSFNSSISGFGGYKVQGAEVELSYKYSDGRTHFGKIDCLLSDSDTGDFVIIDYKNSMSSVPSTAKIFACDEELGSFQMPMYATLVRDCKIKAGSNIIIEAAYFYSIKDKGRRATIDDFAGVSKDKKAAGIENQSNYKIFMKDTVEVFEKYANDFENRVEQKKFTPCVSSADKKFVHAEPYKVCLKCDFKGFCRTTFSVGQKKLIQKESESNNEAK